MRKAIEAKFQHCRTKGCVQVCPQEVHYYEDPTDGFVCEVQADTYDEERHFILHNPNQRAIHLIAIDKCLIGQGPNKPKRCDCAFYVDQEITFIEFKLRPNDRSRDADKRQDKRLEEAAEQLRASVLSFEADGFIDKQFTVKAYAHVGFQPLIPAPTTTLTNLEAYINEDTKSFVEFTATNEATF